MEDPEPRARRKQSTTIGSPEGLHLPGILPEPEMVEAAQVTAKDREILADLHEALDEEDRDEESAVVAAPGKTVAVEAGSLVADQGPKPRAQYPWWILVVEGAVGLLLIVGGVVSLPDSMPMGFILIALGLALVLVGMVAILNRPRK